MNRNQRIDRFKPHIIDANAWLGSFREVTWVVGDGRSGTTWLAEWLNVEGKRRFLFEPFHLVYIEPMKSFYPYSSARLAMTHPALATLAKAVFRPDIVKCNAVKCNAEGAEFEFV